jgi:hypothetical protein
MAMKVMGPIAIPRVDRVSSFRRGGVYSGFTTTWMLADARGALFDDVNRGT